MVVGHVIVSGGTLAPGPVDIFRGETLTLSNAILRAGGVSEWGDLRKVRISRQKADGESETLKVNLQLILKSGDLSQDPVLQDGDRVFVPIVGSRFQ